MFTKKLCILICFVAIVGLFFSETTSAQLIRRQIRRALEIPQPGTPGYRVDPQAGQVRRQLMREPLIQGDGRFLERAQKVVSLFTEGGTELKPVAVISLSSFEEFKRVVQLVSKEIRLVRGSEEEPELLNAFLDVYGRIVGQGFDTNQPLGMVLQTDGVLYYPLLFTPLDLNSKIGQTLRKDYATQLPDGRYVLRQEAFNWPLGQLFVQQHNGWLFIATETQLNALPDDPTVLLQGLDKKHLMAARFDLASLPTLSTRAALSLSEMQAVNQAETEIEKATARLGIGYIRSLAEQADFLEYTVSYDEESNDYVIQQKEIVKPNTERARLLRQRRDAQSPFHGFYYPEGAMLASHLNMQLTRIQREQLEIILDESLGKNLLTEEERDYLKQKAVEEPGLRRRTRRRMEIPSEPAESLPSDKPVVTTETTPESTAADEDPRDRLARLLAKAPPEEVEKIMREDALPGESVVTDMPDIYLSKTSEGELGENRNLENVLRKISVCYYWALIGAVRSGKFDGASTCSLEHGILAAYNIVEGEKFMAAFDSVFEEYGQQFPEHYARNVRKDYMESEGFRLSSVSLRLRDFIETAPWGKLVPPAIADSETRVVFAVRKDAVCFAVGPGAAPETRLLEAISFMNRPLPVLDVFFVFSPYEIGQAIALSGDPNRFAAFKMVAAGGNPNARAYATTEFTDTSKTITLRISGLMTPSIWRFRENLREMRYYRGR